MAATPAGGAPTTKASTTGAPASAGILGVDHVALVVRDVEAALSHFAGTLGLSVISDEVTQASGGARLVFLDAGGVALQLVSPTGDAGPMAEHLAARGDGLHHVCLAVADIEAAVAALAPGAEVPIALGGRGRRTAFLPGAPGGMVTELAEVRDGAADGGTDALAADEGLMP